MNSVTLNKEYIMKTESMSEPFVVFAGNIMEAGMIKSLLEDSDIKAYLKDELMGTMNPWWVTPGGLGSVKVVVSPWDKEKAIEVVSNYEHSIKEGI